MTVLPSPDDVLKLLQDRPETTRTFEVAPDVAGRVPLDSVGLRRMDAAELRELAEYLDVDPEALRGPFRVVEADCPRCGRHVTFLDFVKTAVEAGVHDRAHLRDVLAGRAGTWLTVRGRDGGRPVRCATCDQTLRMPNQYSEYSSSNYAYA